MGILRKALEGILPNEILYRKKSPYPKTHHPLYTQIVQTKIERILKEKDGPLFEFINKDRLAEVAKTGGLPAGKPYFGQLMAGPQLLARSEPSITSSVP